MTRPSLLVATIAAVTVTTLAGPALAPAALAAEPARAAAAPSPGPDASLWRAVADQPYGTKALAPVPSHPAPTPTGYRLVQSEVLSRHGARGLSSSYYTELALAMAAEARKAGTLTPLGERFEATTTRMQAANVALGWGNLSARGVTQMRDLGARTAHRAGAGLTADKSYVVLSSGEPRAVASARAFSTGLTGARPDLHLGDVTTDTATLYFHKSDTAYNTYVDTDPELARSLARVNGDPLFLAAARTVLAGLFGQEGVRALETGRVKLVSADGKHSVANVLDAAGIVYGLYSIAPSLTVEGPFDYAQFFPVWTRPLFGRWSDGQDFLEKGPSLRGRTQTYAMARPLLADFFARIGDSDRVGGVFRFSHAEEVIPFLALLQVPGSDRQVPAGAPFSYLSTGWFGSRQSPLGANVQWDVYEGPRHEKVVRMLLDETPTRFKASCRSVGANLYRVEELKRCYAEELGGA